MTATIYGLSTLYGKSGLAVIRISGENALSIFTKLTNRLKLTPRKATLCNIVDPRTNELIDEGLITYFPAPNSFTGEDIIELSVHGSVAVINSLLQTLSTFEDLRIALPGEFSKRAFLNGKMDLTRAEGLALLIDAETSIQRKIAINQYQGSLESVYEKWRKILIKILAQIEALIDFPEEDIPIEVLNNAQTQVNDLKERISIHLDDNKRGEVIMNGIKVAIIGPPNVGKSTLINYISSREVAIVSDIPGTTRDAIEVKIDIEGYPFIFIDTAGIREEARDIIEVEGIRRSLERMKNADIKIIMIDEKNIYFLNEIDKYIDSTDSTFLILNKIDLKMGDIDLTLNNFIKANRLQNIGEIFDKSFCRISVKDKINLEQFYGLLLKLAKLNYSPADNPIITKVRYREALNRTLNFLTMYNLDTKLEIRAEYIRTAAAELSHITGIIDVEDILDEIFSSFCIGK